MKGSSLQRQEAGSRGFTVFLLFFFIVSLKTHTHTHRKRKKSEWNDTIRVELRPCHWVVCFFFSFLIRFFGFVLLLLFLERQAGTPVSDMSPPPPTLSGSPPIGAGAWDIKPLPIGGVGVDPTSAASLQMAPGAYLPQYSWYQQAAASMNQGLLT